MPDSATARCHCGGVEMVAAFPSRFCAHCYCFSCRATHAAGVVTFESEHDDWGGEMHLPLALFVTPVDRVPTVNSFPEERPEWAPFHPL